MDSNVNWDGKKARIEILKDEHRLIYTATNIIIKDGVISFTDRTGTRFGFSTTLVTQIHEILGDPQ